jgi:hypothetical protein
MTTVNSVLAKPKASVQDQLKRPFQAIEHGLCSVKLR